MTVAAIVSSILSPEDTAMFGCFGILTDLLAEARVQRVSDCEARSEFGIKGSPSMDMAGVIFPYYIPAVEYRVTARLRRDKPEIEEDGKAQEQIHLPLWRWQASVFSTRGGGEIQEAGDAYRARGGRKIRAGAHGMG